MDPLVPKEELENEITRRLRTFLEARGWLVEKTHGSLYLKGWPDLFCAHPHHGIRWIEMKRPGSSGNLEASQRTKFRRWADYNVPVYILVDATEAEYKKLFGPPNWWRWCHHTLKTKKRARR